MKVLMKTTDVYRVDTENEAIEMINHCKEDSIVGGYTLTKSGYVMKTKKSKGEIIDSWCVVNLEKTYNE